MQQVCVVIHNLQRFATLDADFPRTEFAAFLRNRILRQSLSYQRAQSDQNGCACENDKEAVRMPHRFV